jgi:hypothetical protein
LSIVAPVIPDTLEAEGRIKIWGWLKQKVMKTLISTNKLRVVVYVYVESQLRAGGVAQVVSTCLATVRPWVQIPSTKKKRERIPAKQEA